MEENKSNKNKVNLGNLEDKSFEAYKRLIEGMAEKLGIPSDRKMSDEELRKDWKEFWSE